MSSESNSDVTGESVDSRLVSLLKGLGFNPDSISRLLIQQSDDIFLEVGEMLTQGDVTFEMADCSEEDGVVELYPCISIQENGSECYEEPEGMLIIDEEQKDEDWPMIKSIIVNSEIAKDQLLKASKYIHNLRHINSDYAMVNTIMHLYLADFLIKVENDG